MNNVTGEWSLIAGQSAEGVREAKGGEPTREELAEIESDVERWDGLS